MNDTNVSDLRLDVNGTFVNNLVKLLKNADAEDKIKLTIKIIEQLKQLELNLSVLKSESLSIPFPARKTISGYEEKSILNKLRTTHEAWDKIKIFYAQKHGFAVTYKILASHIGKMNSIIRKIGKEGNKDEDLLGQLNLNWERFYSLVTVLVIIYSYSNKISLESALLPTNAH